MTALLERARLLVSGGASRGSSLQLAVCVVGVVASLSVYGVLQERVMTMPFGPEKSFFQHSLFLVLCNRLVTCAVAVAAILLTPGESLMPSAPLSAYSAVALSNVASTACQYDALKYLSFPVQTLAKCAKMLPVMFWGSCFLRKSYGSKDLLVAVMVTGGCMLFFLNGSTAPTTTIDRLAAGGGLVGSEGLAAARSRGALSFAGGGLEGAAGMSSLRDGIIGAVLMGGYLAADGFTSTLQEGLYASNKAMSVNNLLLFVNLVSAGFSVVGLLMSRQLGPAIKFVLSHPDCVAPILILSAAATMGQQFIAYTIRTRGALLLTIVMTTRQLVSIVLSCVFFAHPLTALQWAGAGAVFAALYSDTIARQWGRSFGPKPVGGSSSGGLLGSPGALAGPGVGGRGAKWAPPALSVADRDADGGAGSGGDGASPPGWAAGGALSR